MLRNKSAKNEIEKELKVIREESLQIIDRSQKPRKIDNDNEKSKLQVIINAIGENKGINKKHTVKNKSIKPEYKSGLLHKTSDNNILSSKNLLQKYIWEQFICGKFYTIKSNKNIIILQPRN